MPARILPLGPLTSAASTAVASAADPGLMERLLRRCTYDSKTSCLLWTGAQHTQGGYGLVFVDGKPVSAHRAAYQAYYGFVPKGSLKHESSSAEVHHTCGRRTCCSPDHLEVLSRGEHCAVHNFVSELKVAA